jgi:hypothetical protein
MPRTSVHIAEELRTALDHAGIGGPYILVGSVVQQQTSNIER